MIEPTSARIEQLKMIQMMIHLSVILGIVPVVSA